ncbi:MAG: 7-carboxy-7-deazaguanine synthase QueE [Phycisphaeraceae bacterium]|nr:7-carboxy-7-deazaguanine synthase QueE [Phycisphaeraceae bacterium]
MTAEPTADAGLRIAETFVSIQGEGKLVGIPSWFVRLSGCNLRCTWCDTPHASWNPEGPRRSIDDLVVEARRSGVRHAVVTGGEPMMFPGVTELTRRLADEVGMHITIETAGTVVRPVSCHLMSISPKLANSTPGPGDPRDPGGAWAARHEERRLDFAAIQALIKAHPSPACQLKFVVSREEDIAEIEGVLARLTGWAPVDVLLMPEGVSTPARALTDMILRHCVARSWRYCPRLHIQLFGHTRRT